MCAPYGIETLDRLPRLSTQRHQLNVTPVKASRSLGAIEQDADAAIGSGKANNDAFLADEPRTTLGAQPSEPESRS
jgi:hypothetical protein